MCDASEIDEFIEYELTKDSIEEVYQNEEDEDDPPKPICDEIIEEEEFQMEHEEIEEEEESKPFLLSEAGEQQDEEDIETKDVIPLANTPDGPRRYLLFDELVATIVDYDAENTPIVEFTMSGPDTDEKLPIECGICPDVMAKSKLPKHLKTHKVPGTNRYACIYCDETYKEHKYLAGHARRHMGIRPYVCEPCKLYFSTKQDLRVHNQRRHQAKEHICEICGKTFSQNTMLKRHRESTHEKMRRFQCDHCPKAYYKNYALQEHVRNVHLGKRRMLVCPFCGMECRDAHKMARHRKQLHLNKTHFECDICQEEFTDINYFDAHKRSIQCRNNTRRKMEEEGECVRQQIGERECVRLQIEDSECIRQQFEEPAQQLVMQDDQLVFEVTLVAE